MMNTPQHETGPGVVLELTVNNHPGVMSHVCGLFSRRAFNVEKIACVPLGGTGHSRIWLHTAEDARLEQMIRQMKKLEDVIGVTRHGPEHPVFASLEAITGDLAPAPAP